MTPEQITQVIQGGQWVSIATELCPSTNKSATGEILLRLLLRTGTRERRHM